MSEHICLNNTLFDPYGLDDIEKLLSYLVSLLQNHNIENKETKICEVIIKWEKGEISRFLESVDFYVNSTRTLHLDIITLSCTIEEIIKFISLLLGELLLTYYKNNPPYFDFFISHNIRTINYYSKICAITYILHKINNPL